MSQQNIQQQQQLASVNSSLKLQLETQKQQLINANQTITSMNNVLSTTITQVSNLQTQIDVTKSDVKTVQNQITGINGLINNINNVNAAQTADINTLKAQSGQNMNGAFWCQMQRTYGYFNYYDLNQKITGYCPNLKYCCYRTNNYVTCNQATKVISQSSQNPYYYRYEAATFSNNQCGTFVPF
ncbi:Hypothetical_protein [Hexamita inflata]|uniref:Hypothetical_protein n=1 Tax=Hexamita inflata TaxID=28002 RepID=A0AA86NCG7_9EUKA|nr:Hypothetical protein HINF_LOCUS4251 [Hexamita inflata]